MDAKAENNARKIKACMKSKGITGKEIANRMGVTPQAVSYYLSGDLSLTRAQDIANILGVTLDQMLEEKPEPQTECDTVTIQGKKYKVTFTPIDE